MVVSATANLFGDAGDSATCWIESNSSGTFTGGIAEFVFVDFAAANQDVPVSLVAFDNNATGGFTARVRCSSTNGVSFDRGTITNQIAPG